MRMGRRSLGGISLFLGAMGGRLFRQVMILMWKIAQDPGGLLTERISARVLLVGKIITASFAEKSPFCRSIRILLVIGGSP